MLRTTEKPTWFSELLLPALVVVVSLVLLKIWLSFNIPFVYYTSAEVLIIWISAFPSFEKEARPNFVRYATKGVFIAVVLTVAIFLTERYFPS